MKFSKIIQFVVNFIFCCALIGLCLKSIDDINIQSGKVKNNINLISKRIKYPAFSNLMNYANKIINIMNYMFIIGSMMLIFKISSIGHSFIVTGFIAFPNQLKLFGYFASRYEYANPNIAPIISANV